MDSFMVGFVITIADFLCFFFSDEFYNRYIVKGNLLTPVVDAFLRNNGRYNLLDSAILELFEFIKMEDIKSLCVYVVDTFGKALDKVEYVQTFKCLRLRYDQQQDRITERSTSALDRYLSSTDVLKIPKRSIFLTRIKVKSAIPKNCSEKKNPQLLRKVAYCEYIAFILIFLLNNLCDVVMSE